MTASLDTRISVNARHREMVSHLEPQERLARAFALSDFVRQLALEGARRHVGSDAPAGALRRRMLQQMFGVVEGARFDALMQRRTRDG
jgi:hypothetical protein